MCTQDPPAYYDPLGGLLAFDMHLGEGLLEGAAPLHEGKNVSDFGGHFALMNAQLAQARVPPVTSPEPCTALATRCWPSGRQAGNPGGRRGCKRAAAHRT